MSREITPLDLDKLEGRLWRTQTTLKAILETRMPSNYLGTKGARMTLKRARQEVGYAIECLKTAANTISEAREDSGNFKIANQ